MPKGIFHPIDHIIFQQIDKLKTSSPYQQVADLTSGLSDFQQKIINQIVTAIIISIPIIISLLFFYSNHILKQEIHTKNEILRLVGEYGQKKGQVGTLERSVLAPSALNTKSDLERRVRNLLSREGIDSKKVRVKSFEQSSPASSISLSTADINFKKLSIKDLSGLMQGLVYTEKAKIAQLLVKRNVKTQFLDGDIKIQHYGKAQAGKN